jgi:hypothetical protein
VNTTAKTPRRPHDVWRLNRKGAPVIDDRAPRYDSDGVRVPRRSSPARIAYKAARVARRAVKEGQS